MLSGHLNGSSRAMLSALKTAVRHAILVMMALPDENTHHRYQLRSVWIGVPDDPNNGVCVHRDKDAAARPDASRYQPRRDRRQFVDLVARRTRVHRSS
jgi:hypothetical protein